MILGENKLWILMMLIEIDINERQDQTFTSRSNIYVCDNNGRELYLLGINALVTITCSDQESICFCAKHLQAEGSAQR